MYFTIERRSGGFRALAYGDNHEKMFWSEVYTSKSSAKHAISVLKMTAGPAPVLDRA